MLGYRAPPPLIAEPLKLDYIFFQSSNDEYGGQSDYVMLLEDLQVDRVTEIHYVMSGAHKPPPLTAASSRCSFAVRQETDNDMEGNLVT